MSLYFRAPTPDMYKIGCACSHHELGSGAHFTQFFSKSHRFAPAILHIRVQYDIRVYFHAQVNKFQPHFTYIDTQKRPLSQSRSRISLSFAFLSALTLSRRERNRYGVGYRS